MEGHGGELLVSTLAGYGVDSIFTLSGGHIFSVYDGAVKAKWRIVDVRHEQTATWAAEGMAKLTRKPGVAVLTAGPGVTNGVSAMTTAHFNGSPLVVLGGRAPQGRWGAGSLQELDHVPIVLLPNQCSSPAATCGGTAHGMPCGGVSSRCAFPRSSTAWAAAACPPTTSWRSHEPGDS